jgi:hypothetical protein
MVTQGVKKDFVVSVTQALVGVLIAGGFVAIAGMAQESGLERAASLRAQLVEVRVKQAELQARLQQLEENLKPENIEHSLAGVGSTHPEELREARRRQLESQKTSAQSELEILAASRTRLEASIATADAESSHMNAGISAGQAQVNNGSAVVKSTRRHKYHLMKKRRPPKATG